jgi:hypothetical protein
MSDDIDFGPLAPLIGVWKGDKGTDVAPGRDGATNIPFHETLTFTEVGTVRNAGAQTLSVLRYHQTVQRNEDGETFHDEIGYWMWDPAEKTVMHSLHIPRGVCVLAGGIHSGNTEGVIKISVAAGVDDADWKIIQSPFMEQNARTTAFTHDITVDGDTLTYAETTFVDIYGKAFDHTDNNVLTRQKS